MASSFLDKNGLIYFWKKIKTELSKRDNKIEVLKVNGVTQPITNKEVNVVSTEIEMKSWTTDDMV